MTDRLAEAKALIREKMRGIRNGFDAETIREKSARIAERLRTFEPFANAETVCCYLALPYEVQTEGILDLCWSAGRRVCVPFFDAAEDEYGLAWLEKADAVRPGPAGIPQPIGIRRAPPGVVDLMIVPGVAFDAFGRRLGHGGGHYDQLLSQGRAFKIGIAFESQLIDPVPTGPDDVTMDVVVTECRIYPSAAQAAGDVAKP